MTHGPLTYAQTGVDYDPIDRFKRLCQAAAVRTAGNLKRLSFRDVEWSRGESAYLFEQYTSFYGSQKLAFVEEGLGTKELVAAKMLQLTGLSQYRNIAQCTLAMIVNDIATLALPLVVSMHCATGTSKWFDHEARCRDLAEGYADACMLARCSWGCGETPVLKGVIHEHAALLSGAAVGIVPEFGITGAIEDGDAIVILESSGIHANGLTLARQIAEKLPKGYLTEMPHGRTYGDVLLDPTHIYAGFVEDCLNAKIGIHYAVNITGHGWRKLMRSGAKMTYTIVTMPECPPIFDFIQERGPVTRREMFANFNMGAGFALCVRASDTERLADIVYAADLPFKVILAGFVTKSDKKRVVIEPEKITFEEEELQVR